MCRHQWTKRGELQNRRLQVRFLSHLPLVPEFMLVAALWPQHNMCVLTPICPQFTPSGATPQISECSPLGDGYPNTPGTSRPYASISNLTPFLAIPEPNLKCRSYALIELARPAVDNRVLRFLQATAFHAG